MILEKQISSLAFPHYKSMGLIDTRGIAFLDPMSLIGKVNVETTQDIATY